MKKTTLDIMAFVGFVSVIYGVALIYVPAALIVGGVTVAALSVQGAKRWA